MCLYCSDFKHINISGRKAHFFIFGLHVLVIQRLDSTSRRPFCQLCSLNCKHIRLHRRWFLNFQIAGKAIECDSEIAKLYRKTNVFSKINPSLLQVCNYECWEIERKSSKKKDTIAVSFFFNRE